MNDKAKLIYTCIALAILLGIISWGAWSFGYDDGYFDASQVDERAKVVNQEVDTSETIIVDDLNPITPKDTVRNDSAFYATPTPKSEKTWSGVTVGCVYCGDPIITPFSYKRYCVKIVDIKDGYAEFYHTSIKSPDGKLRWHRYSFYEKINGMFGVKKSYPHFISCD